MRIMEASKVAEISPQTIHAWINKGQLVHYEIESLQGITFIDRDELMTLRVTVFGEPGKELDPRGIAREED